MRINMKMERLLHEEHSRVTEAPLEFDLAGLAATTKPIDAPFVTWLAHPSKWFAPRGMKPVCVVIHCTAGENPASSTAAFFASSTPSGSTQAVADNDEGFTMVPDDAVCAGAPPMNQPGLHIEQPGLVTWTRDKWLAQDNQLRRVAFWTAEKCKLYDIPVKLLHLGDLPANPDDAHGITYHDAVSRKYHESTHDDPGPNFPWDIFMGYVNFYFTGGDMAVLTDAEQLRVRGLLKRFARTGAPDPSADPNVKSGFEDADEVIDAAMKSPTSNHADHHHSIPAGNTGGVA